MRWYVLYSTIINHVSRDDFLFWIMYIQQHHENKIEELITWNVLTSHSYHTRNSSFPVTEERSSSPGKKSELIVNLLKKILSRFDGPDKELSNLKDVTIKDLQIENYWL